MGKGETTSFLVAALALLYFLLPPNWKSTRKSFPGPQPLPLVGNFLMIRKLRWHPEKPFLELKRQWGKACTLWYGPQPVLVISDPKMAKELLNERSAIYSSRPPMNNFRQELWPWRLVAMPAGDEFRSVRKLYHNYLNAQHSKQFRVYEDYESSVMMGHLLEQPQSFLDSVNRYTLSVVFSVVYGARLSSLDQPIIAKFNGLWDVLNKYFEPGTLAMDFIPGLEHLPMMFQPWPKHLQTLAGEETRLHRAFLNTLQEAVRQGTAPDCFGKLLVQAQREESISDETTTHILAMLIVAGADTSASLLQNVFKVIALQPEAVAKAQAELDRVVGPHRLPTWDDESSLPYVRSFIKEVHRWDTMGDFGIPHYATKDDVYEGHSIQKGTIVFPNLPGLSYDSDRYDDPDVFDPDRFQGYDASASALTQSKDYRQRDHFSYGFGRRVCPGIHVAEASIFIVISRLLWGFNVTQDPKRPLEKANKYHILIWKPNPFKVNIESRGPAFAKTIQSASHSRQTNILSFDDVLKNV